MRRLLLLASLLLVAAPATAAPRKSIVLQSEGRADAATRAQIDAALVKLAGSDNAQVVAGETTLTDTATAVGCSPDQVACRDEVIGMLGVDELVFATVTPKPGGVELVVYRASRGATREAKVFIQTGASTEDLGAVASLFSDAATEPAVESTENGTLGPVTEPVAPVIVTEPQHPGTQIDGGPSRTRTRLQIAGMAGGGAMVLAGFLLWGEAGTIQEEIDVHPTATREQLEALAELERRGDRYATWGNVFFLGGAILGGVSTYLYVKDRKAHSARVAPAVMGSGAGFTLTFGGSR